MGLDWDQKKYDRNGDGRLNFWEESDWHSYKYWSFRQVMKHRDRNREEPVFDEIDPLDVLVYNILDGMRTQLKDENKLEVYFWKLTCYTLSWALLDATRIDAMKSVQALFQRYPNDDADEMFSLVACGKRAFDLKFHLDAERIGSFWRNLIPTLPPYVAYLAWPDGLFDMLDGMADVYADLVGVSAETVFDSLEKAFATHWRRHTLLEPDLEVSKAAVAQWDFSVHEWACRDLLVASYPQLVKDWTLEEIDDANVSDILSKTYGTDPQTAIKMWQLLLDTANTQLSDCEAAGMLVCRYADWIAPVDYNVDYGPILDALESNAHFAAQVFQSANVSMVQRNLLAHCVVAGREELYQTLHALLAENSLPKKEWDISLKEIDRVVGITQDRNRSDSCEISPKKSTVQADDGRSYYYCLVRCDGISQAYSYITEDRSIQVGDYVLIPFGKDNQECTGKVEQVGTYTAATAPYPPERTKHITSKTETPSEPEKTVKPTCSV